MSLDDVALPRLQSDGSRVLPARTVLAVSNARIWRRQAKQAGPDFPADYHDRSSGSGASVESAARLDRPHRCHHLGCQSRVRRIVEDRQGEHLSARFDEVPITQVPPQEVCISRLVQLSTVAAGTGRCEVALSARLPAALVQPPPPANRLDGDTGDEGVVGISQADVREVQSPGHGGVVANLSHAPASPKALTSRPRNRAGWGSRTPTPLRAALFESAMSACSINPAARPRSSVQRSLSGARRAPPRSTGAHQGHELTTTRGPKRLGCTADERRTPILCLYHVGWRPAPQQHSEDLCVFVHNRRGPRRRC